MTQVFMENVAAELPGLELKQNEPMKNHTTFRIGGNADFYAEPDEKQIARLIELARKSQLDVTIIGNGSNLLVADKGIRGLVIAIGKNMSAVTVTGNTITAQAGAMLSAVAAQAARSSLGGMEFAAGIPGSIGGAVVMNAGAYGGEIKDIITKATVLTASGDIKELSRDELSLSYRYSIIPENRYIVLSAQFELIEKPQQQINELMAELREKRIEKQPLEYPSAGSTFKRPEGYFAGKLIMDCGLRGYSVGDAQVSQKHCGFVINNGKATAADVCRLMSDVSRKVHQEYGVELEPEVKMIGEF